MNILNTGWEMNALNLFLGLDPGPPGLFDRVDLDFRDAAATRAVGWLDNGDGSFTFGFAAQGDTNLDGRVSLDDLMNILAGGKYGSGTAATWAEGDFNYDGVVNLDDLMDVLGTCAHDQAAPTPRPGVPLTV